MMQDLDNSKSSEDSLDLEIDQSLKELHKQLKTISSEMSSSTDNDDWGGLSEKLGVDIEKFLTNLVSDENNLLFNTPPENEITTKPVLNLSYTKTHEDAIDPFYNYSGDSCFDLYSVIETKLKPNQRGLVPTGLNFDIPDYTELQVRTKSGLAINQGLIVLNSPGTIDSGYIGEVKVILYNTSSEEILIKKGQKIAQCCLCPIYSGSVVKLEQKTSLETKDRGENGFGSTGI
jgi:dUTP pyrophosphatase